MKILHEEQPWPSKVNFIDENEAHLGFDTYNECCSDGGWFLADKPGLDLRESFKEQSMDLPGWTFDPAYFNGRPAADAGEYVEFRIVNGDQEKFITLYNHHNGYYSKGFEFVCPKAPEHNKEKAI